MVSSQVCKTCLKDICYTCPVVWRKCILWLLSAIYKAH